MAFELIDAGAGTSYTGGKAAGSTYLDNVNLATVYGLIDSFAISFNADSISETIKFGTFSGTAPNFTIRDYDTGTKDANAHLSTFTGRNITIDKNDLLGVYTATATLGYKAGAAGESQYVAGDKFGAGATAYTAGTNFQMAYYATGYTYPDPPNSCSITNDLAGKKVTISWTNPVGEQYIDYSAVNRDEGPGTSQHTIYYAAVGTTTYDDTTVLPNILYTYIVYTHNPVGWSGVTAGVGRSIFDGTQFNSGVNAGTGKLSCADNSTVDSDTWREFQVMLTKSVKAGNLSRDVVVSTYSLVYTVANAYAGGVLAPNGDIHFVPNGANRGQKISAAGVVSTYSLVYTVADAYEGGVLVPNGDIHFIPRTGNRGQKIDINGVVSTYSLVYTTSSAYVGGVLAPNGDIHFIPLSANKGQKISAAGVVSTYSLVYTVVAAYAGGVLAPNGDIHFIPLSANRGQKIDINGVVSTYSLVYTVANAYAGGVLAPNGDIHFVPLSATCGQKIDINGVVSTYSLVYTTSTAYLGGVLAPNGDIYFVPCSANCGQKIDTTTRLVSTYSLVYTVGTGYIGGVLAPNGDIHFVPYGANVGQKISTNPAIPFSLGVCCHPYFNKF